MRQKHILALLVQPNISLKLKAIQGLIKPELPFAAGVCVIAGQIMSLGHLPSTEYAIWGFLVGFFLSGSAMVSNDYFDVEVDRVNHPARPLPSGSVSMKEVVMLTVLLSFAGMTLAALFGQAAFIFAAIILAVGILYNWKIKESGIAGNLMVSFSVASTFLFGGLSVGALSNPLVWTFASIAFLFNLAEEIASGAMDIKGDRLRGSRSIAILKGRDYALRISGGILAILMMLSLVPFFAGWLGAVYLFIAAITDSLLILIFLRLYRSRTPEDGRREIRHLYIAMTCFVVAFMINIII